jgi:hypothetical protein
MGNFVGRVYDVDFIPAVGWCQVLMTNEQESLIARTVDERIQSLIETGFITGSNKTSVDYLDKEGPKWITGVKLKAGDKQGLNKVISIELSVDVPYCRASITRQGQDGHLKEVEVTVLDPRFQGVLLCAIANPDADFEFAEDQGNLTRAKINLG